MGAVVVQDRGWRAYERKGLGTLMDTPLRRNAHVSVHSL